MARNALCTEIFQVFNCRVATSLSVRRSRNFSSTLVEAAVLIIYRTSIDCLKNISPHHFQSRFLCVVRNTQIYPIALGIILGPERHHRIMITCIE